MEVECGLDGMEGFGDETLELESSEGGLVGSHELVAICASPSTPRPTERVRVGSSISVDSTNWWR